MEGYEESGWDIVSEHKDPEITDIQDCFYEFKHSHRDLSNDMGTLLNNIETAIEKFVLEMSKIEKTKNKLERIIK